MLIDGAGELSEKLGYRSDRRPSSRAGCRTVTAASALVVRSLFSSIPFLSERPLSGSNRCRAVSSKVKA